MMLSLEDIVTLFNNKYNIKMLLQLERHIIQLNQYSIIPVTSLDFLLYFVMGHQQFWKCLPHEAAHLHVPSLLVDKCLPVLHYSAINYQISSQTRKSSIAIAAVCYVIQELDDEVQHFEARATAKT